MKKYMFYRVVREEGGVDFLEAGVAWFEADKGTIVQTSDQTLARLLKEPIEVRHGGTAPYTVRPQEERYLLDAINELHDKGYLGRQVEE